MDTDLERFPSKKNETLAKVDERLLEVSRITRTPSSISNSGNQSEIIPTNTGGRGGVESNAKIGRFFYNTRLLPKIAAFINKLSKGDVVNAETFGTKLITALGQELRDEHSNYVRFTMPDATNIYLRISDHASHARNAIGKRHADKKYSIVILVESSPNVKFKPSRAVTLVEYVYDHPDRNRLINIAKSVFHLIDVGEYTDLADANAKNISPRPQEERIF